MLKVGGLLQKASGAGKAVVRGGGAYAGDLLKEAGGVLKDAGGDAGGLLEKVQAKTKVDPLGAALRQLLNTESAAVPKEVLEDLCRRATEDQEGAGGRVAKHIESHLKASSSQWRRIHGALVLLDHALRIRPADIEAIGKWGLKLPELRTELKGLKNFDKDKDKRACKLVQNKASAVDRELERCGIPGPPTSPKPKAAAAKPEAATGSGAKAATSNGSSVAKAAAPKVATVMPIALGRLRFDELPTKGAPQSPPHSDSDKECEESTALYPSPSWESASPVNEKPRRPSIGDLFSMAQKDEKKKSPTGEKRPSDSSAFGDWGLKQAMGKVSDARDKVVSKLPVRESSLPNPNATLVGKPGNKRGPNYSEEQFNLLGGISVTKKEVTKGSSKEPATETSTGPSKCCASFCRCFFRS